MEPAFRIRSGPLVLLIVLLIGGCGDGGMSMTEYGDRIDALAAEAGRRAEELFAEAAGVTDVAPEQLSRGLERGLQEIRIPLQQGVDEIDPPDAIADLHNLMWGWHADFISIEQALAERVGATEDTEAGWTELSDSPEMATYRAALVEGKRICNTFQVRLDGSEMGDAFVDTPWTPAEMTEIVEAALGCQWFPENPEEVYLYPPAG